ncbi:MAG: hypothetical protein PVH61_36610 [Candidatus Aminicenantes bacterium]
MKVKKKLSGNPKKPETKKGEITMKMKKIIISMIITLSLMSLYCYGYFYANWPCLLYEGQCETDTSKQSSIQNLSPTLGQLSIEAAGFFLQSNSDYQAFLKKIELSEIYGINDEELKELITGAIENMEIAHSIYYRVWQMSKSLERNPLVLQKLAQFDYGLILEEKSLITSIFNEVERYLKKGNMPGAFERIYIDTGDILQEMKSLESMIQINSIDIIIPLCWEVNQRLLESTLFGQYISHVFYEIKKSIM